ncbi:hypothetical protein P9112_007457 [Eukaryota sp. TZLM1-RC]
MPSSSPRKSRRSLSAIPQMDPFFSSCLDALTENTQQSVYHHLSDYNDPCTIEDLSPKSHRDPDIEQEAERRLSLIKANPFSKPLPQPLSTSTNPSLVHLTPRTMRSVLTGSKGTTPIRKKEISYNHLLKEDHVDSLLYKRRPHTAATRTVPQTVAQLLKGKHSSRKVTRMSPSRRPVSHIDSADLKKEGLWREESEAEESMTVEREGQNVETDDVVGQKDEVESCLVKESQDSNDLFKTLDSLSSQSNKPLTNQTTNQFVHEKISFAGPQRSIDDLINDPFRGLYSGLSLSSKSTKVKGSGDQVKIFENLAKNLLKKVENSVHTIQDNQANSEDINYQIGILNELKIILESVDRDAMFKEELINLPDYEIRDKLLTVSRDHDELKSKYSDLRETNCMLELRLQSMEKAVMDVLGQFLNEKNEADRLRERIKLLQSEANQSTSQVLVETAISCGNLTESDVDCVDSGELGPPMTKATNTYSKVGLKFDRFIDKSNQTFQMSSDKSVSVNFNLLDQQDNATDDLFDIPSIGRQAVCFGQTDKNQEKGKAESKVLPKILSVEHLYAKSFLDNSRSQRRSSNSEPFRHSNVTIESSVPMYSKSKNSVTQSRNFSNQVDFNQSNNQLINQSNNQSCIECEANKLRLSILEQSISSYTNELSLVKQRLGTHLANSFSLEGFKEQGTQMSTRSMLSICPLHRRTFFPSSLPRPLSSKEVSGWGKEQKQEGFHEGKQLDKEVQVEASIDLNPASLKEFETDLTRVQNGNSTYSMTKSKNSMDSMSRHCFKEGDFGDSLDKSEPVFSDFNEDYPSSTSNASRIYSGGLASNQIDNTWDILNSSIKSKSPSLSICPLPSMSVGSIIDFGKEQRDQHKVSKEPVDQSVSPIEPFPFANTLSPTLSVEKVNEHSVGILPKSLTTTKRPLKPPKTIKRISCLRIVPLFSEFISLSETPFATPTTRVYSTQRTPSATASRPSSTLPSPFRLDLSSVEVDGDVTSSDGRGFFINSLLPSSPLLRPATGKRDGGRKQFKKYI